MSYIGLVIVQTAALCVQVAELNSVSGLFVCTGADFAGVMDAGAPREVGSASGVHPEKLAPRIV